MSKDGKTPTKPLPFSATLRDLALLRMSGLDVGSLVPTESIQSESLGDRPANSAGSSVEQSHEFAQQARAAMKLYNLGEVERVGEGVEVIRQKVEELSEGLHDER
ncbi:hypothetical protein R3P38DRAFT_2887857 [Favolaschia claudopus]|uniref:Uncharacterized protein n=1 Tax=Favolaschia claudopus TaxID=2862362 RepID=A0AAW0CYB0_9AGAR